MREISSDIPKRSGNRWDCEPEDASGVSLKEPQRGIAARQAIEELDEIF
jgi:hypothetical protein